MYSREPRHCSILVVVFPIFVALQTPSFNQTTSALFSATHLRIFLVRYNSLSGASLWLTSFLRLGHNYPFAIADGWNLVFFEVLPVYVT